MFHACAWAIPLVALMLGCRIVLVNRFMDPVKVSETLIETGCTLSCGVPAIWQMLRQALQADPAKIAKCKGVLKTLICGGSAPPHEMMMWFHKEIGAEFRHVWGMTEMNPMGSCSSFIQTQEDNAKTAAERAEKLKYQGMPFFCVEWCITDPEDFEKTLPHDGETTGELLVKGPAVTAHYWKGVGKDKFHKGFLKTGDVATIAPKELMQIKDRSKDVVKSGGEFISSIDLENTVVSMQGVVSACVVAVPHPKWDERPIVIIVLAEGQAAPSHPEMCKFLEKSRFAKFQWPDDILVWDAIPMTGTGKMDKKAVRQKLQDSNYVLPELRAPQSRL
eukprot:gnl/MRDRNA2_/MRDRNA2_15908_c0_seq1.p1 gnl/MRDRNA2_/MRDRNA2_15908_c0~~gnl/MRDRNA2_/MRDRNA2_15908_c0_seq1.p1  ORF type:complete len:355 (+),score=70.39 gnl/MRDRNA2_/MRDRNA2_15908_c0_seq1:69-1067(+)